MQVALAAGPPHRFRPDDPHVPVDAPRAAGIHQSGDLADAAHRHSAADSPADDARLLAMQQNLVKRLASVPGVSSVSLMDGLPMTGFMSQDPIFASDHSYAANQIPPLRRLHQRRARRLPGAGRTAGRRPRVRLDRSPTEAQGRR